MGPEPLEWLHVSLINTATALDTVPLINERDTRERTGRRGNGENQLKILQRDNGREVQEKQNW